jgi:hypothetical protein
MGLSIQSYNCSTWALFGLLLGFVPHVEFYCHLNGIKIIVVPFGFAFFAFFLLYEALNEHV